MTASSVLTGVLLKGTFAARPAANTVAGGTLYSATDTNVIYQSDGSSWATYATVGSGAPTDATYITQTANGSLSAEQALSSLSTGLVKVTTGTGVLSTASASDLPSHDHAGTSDGGKLTNDAHDGYSIYEEIAAPSAPAADTARLYAKDNGSGTTELYYKNSGGTERDLSAAGSGLSDQGTATYLDFAEAAAPATPAANKVRIYAKADGSLYQKDDAGLETGLAGGGSAPSHTYFAHLCAFLEPLAIEKVQTGTFSYAVGSSVTKYLLSAWNCRIGASGRIDLRDMRSPLPLRNITLVGIDSGSIAAIIDPALPTYTDSWTTYYDRLAALAALDTKYLGIASLSGSANTPFAWLPGPYGSMILHVTTFNAAWVALSAQGSAGAFPLQDELGDAATDWVRFGNTMLLPVSKNFGRGIIAGFSGGVGTAAGAVVYAILPSTWGKVTDSTSYIFRDDFMGTTLDTTTKWTRTQSTAGNVEIDTNFAWLKIKGNGSWGTNGAFSQTSTSRATGKVFMCDVAINPTDTHSGSDWPNLIVGWHDGSGVADTDFAHGLDFTSTGGAAALFVFEGGTSRGEVGSDWTKGHTYRVRITLGASNNATYEIQGGPEYAPLGGATWTDITPGTTSNSTTPLHAGVTTAATSGLTQWVGDVKLY